MFTSLESGKDQIELQNGGLSLKRNPLVVSIIDGCETLKALAVKNKITAELISNAKGLILMRTDKVSAPSSSHSTCTAVACPLLTWLQLLPCRLALVSLSRKAMGLWSSGNQAHHLDGKASHERDQSSRLFQSLVCRAILPCQDKSATVAGSNCKTPVHSMCMSHITNPCSSTHDTP
jgi:hypothetical protein